MAFTDIFTTTKKYDVQAASAELLVALMPAFQAFTDLLKTAVIPAITKLSEWFGGMSKGQQQALLVLLMVIIFLPKLITLIKGVVTVFKLVRTATLAQAAATGTMTTSGESSLTINLADYSLEDGRHQFYVSADGEGVEVNQSNTVTYYVGVAPVFGVAWTNDESTTVQRTDDAIGLSYAIQSSDGSIASDFNEVFPWNEATVETVDGNTMMHMPEMFFRVTADAAKRITSVAVSKVPSGEGNWHRVAPFYYACYGASLEGNMLKSKSGVGRYHSATRALFRDRAKSAGNGYQQLDLSHKTVMTFLWWIEWAVKDSASIMPGKTSATGQVALPTGGTDVVTTPSGFVPSTKQMRYHYIEDFVGNYLEWVDGASYGNSRELFVCADPSKFSDGYADANYTKLGYLAPSVSGLCITAFGWDEANPFMVYPCDSVTDGNYAKGFCDGCWYGSASNTVLCAGADWSDSYAFRGVCYFDSTTSSSTYTGIGGRLLYNP